MSNDFDDDDTAAQMSESATCVLPRRGEDDRWSMRTRIVGSLQMHVTFWRVQIGTKERNFNLTYQMVLLVRFVVLIHRTSKVLQRFSLKSASARSTMN